MRRLIIIIVCVTSIRPACKRLRTARVSLWVATNSNTRMRWSACGASVMSHVTRQTSWKGPRVVSLIQITTGLFCTGDVVVVVSYSIVDEMREFVRIVWCGQIRTKLCSRHVDKHGNSCGIIVTNQRVFFTFLVCNV